MKNKGWSVNKMMLIVLIGLAIFSAISYLQGNQVITLWLILTLPAVAFAWIIARAIDRSTTKKYSEKQLTSMESKKLNRQTLILLILAVALILGSFVI